MTSADAGDSFSKPWAKLSWDVEDGRLCVDPSPHVIRRNVQGTDDPTNPASIPVDYAGALKQGATSYFSLPTFHTPLFHLHTNSPLKLRNSRHFIPVWKTNLLRGSAKLFRSIVVYRILISFHHPLNKSQLSIVHTWEGAEGSGGGMGKKWISCPTWDEKQEKVEFCQRWPMSKKQDTRQKGKKKDIFFKSNLWLPFFCLE